MVFEGNIAEDRFYSFSFSTLHRFITNRTKGIVMVGFFLNIVKLFRAVWYVFKQDEEFRILLFLLLTFLISGTYFYWHVEGWSVVDALYFCFMTMSTIGYGDLVPTTTISKIFTIVYSILSIGVFVAAMAKLVIAIVSRRQDINKHKKHKIHE
jgi:hypothetical protein